MKNIIFITISKYIINLIRFLFPNYCHNCDKILTREDKNCFCAECWESIKTIKEEFCIKCAKPVITPDHICRDCVKRKFYYKQIRAAGIYEKVLKDAIHLYKYSFRWKISDDFMALIKDNIDPGYIKSNDYIITVPVRPNELIKKGFNHTYLILKKMAQEYSLPIIKNIIIKKRDTRPQAGLKRKERLVNLKGAFRINKKYQKIIKNKNLLLFDDVYTTGSTIQEISKELSHYKVKSINVLAIARGR